jgi:hypothetical protein
VRRLSDGDGVDLFRNAIQQAQNRVRIYASYPNYRVVIGFNPGIRGFVKLPT